MKSHRISAALKDTSEPGAKQQLLDSAERIFGKKGYFGATVREIAAGAGQNLGLINYHFGGKEQLFKAVLERRFDVMLEDTRSGVERALGTERSVQSAVRAFLGTFMSKASGSDDGWRDYLLTIARAMSAYDQPGLRETLARTAQFGQVLEDAIASLYPAVERGRVRVSAYFVESLMVFATQDDWVLNVRTKDTFDSHRIDLIVDEMASFVVGGIERLLGEK